MSNRFAGDLKFIGLSEDGEHLIVVSPHDDEFRLRITPMVRAAVRLDRSAMEAAKADHEGTLPPREIQAQIRAGRTAQEISESAHVSLELVQRYEGPVLAERAYVAEQAQRTALGNEPDSPTLGEITVDRLAARGVNTLDIIWDAYKTAGHGWIVSVTFDADSDIRVARWTYKASTKTITAIDDDAKWLSETRIADEPIPRRHLSAVRGEVFDFENAVTGQIHTTKSETDTAQVHTEELLDRLNNARGTRRNAGYPIGTTAVAPVQENNVVELSPHSGASTEDNDVVFDALSAPTVASPAGTNQQSPESAKSATSASDARHDAFSQHSGIVTPEHVVSARSQWAPQDSHITPMTSALSALSSATNSTATTDLVDAESEDTSTGTDLFGEDISKKQAALAAKKARPNGRNPMPTWDEIMFGAKPE